MKTVKICAFLAAVILFPSGLWAKGSNLRIEITGDGLKTPVVIEDSAILDQFSIWNGPGVHTSGPDGNMQTTHTQPDRESLDRRFIDWPSGEAVDRPAGLQRVFVTFFVGFAEQPKQARQYKVVYELSKKGGFIYLPMWRNTLISHGVEGRWFHSTASWDLLVGGLIAINTDERTAPGTGNDPRCIVGPARFNEDGTIEFRYLDEHGNKTSHWRYEESTEGYDRVLAHIGNVQPGESFDLSCWPPRAPAQG